MEKIRAFVRKIFSHMPWLKRLFAFLYELLPIKLRWRLAQRAEFNYHNKGEVGDKKDWINQNSRRILEGFGYSQNDMQDKTVIDIGSGSILMGKFFQGARVIIIEPLADRYMREIPWSDLHLASKAYSLPGEQYISELHNAADFVMCINALDHTREPFKVLENSYNYLKAGGSMLLSVDLHRDFAGMEHPIHFKNNQKLRHYCLSLGFKIEKEFQGVKQGEVQAYGGGLAYSIIMKKQ